MIRLSLQGSALLVANFYCAIWLLALLPLSAISAPLPDLIREAVGTHPSVIAREAAGRSAEAGVDGARWQFFPTPSLVISRAASTSDATYRGDNQVVTAGLQQPLWAGGRIASGMDKAEAERDVSFADLGAIRRQLAIRVVETYGEWYGAYLKFNAADKSVVAHTRLQERIARRVELGASSDADRTLASSRLDQVRSEAFLYRSQKSAAIGRLAQLLGRQLSEQELIANVSGPYPVEKNIERLVVIAEDRDPDLRRLQAQVRSRDADIGVAKAALSPEVFLRVERQYGDFFIPGNSNVDRVFVGVQTSFGAGLSSVSNIGAAKERHIGAQSDVDAMRRTIREQVEVDRAQLDSFASRLPTLQSSFIASEAIQLSYDRQFVGGRKTWLDVMNAAKETTQLEIQLGELRAGFLTVSWRLALNSVGLEDVLGAPRHLPSAGAKSVSGNLAETPYLQSFSVTQDVSEINKIVTLSVGAEKVKGSDIYACDRRTGIWGRGEYIGSYSADLPPEYGRSRVSLGYGLTQNLDALVQSEIRIAALATRKLPNGSVQVQFNQRFVSKANYDVNRNRRGLVRLDGAWKIMNETVLKNA